LGCLEVVVLWLETKKKSFNEINGFLSLQLELRFELGLWLRLTNTKIINGYFESYFACPVCAANVC
jgi:hypothetical protein